MATQKLTDNLILKLWTISPSQRTAFLHRLYKLIFREVIALISFSQESQQVYRAQPSMLKIEVGIHNNIQRESIDVTSFGFK